MHGGDAGLHLDSGVVLLVGRDGSKDEREAMSNHKRLINTINFYFRLGAHTPINIIEAEITKY